MRGRTVNRETGRKETRGGRKVNRGGRKRDGRKVKRRNMVQYFLESSGICNTHILVMTTIF
jgi:hypothetical protein